MDYVVEVLVHVRVGTGSPSPSSWLCGLSALWTLLSDLLLKFSRLILQNVTWSSVLGPCSCALTNYVSLREPLGCG